MLFFSFLLNIYIFQQTDFLITSTLPTIRLHVDFSKYYIIYYYFFFLLSQSLSFKHFQFFLYFYNSDLNNKHNFSQHNEAVN